MIICLNAQIPERDRVQQCNRWQDELTFPGSTNHCIDRPCKNLSEYFIHGFNTEPSNRQGLWGNNDDDDYDDGDDGYDNIDDQAGREEEGGGSADSNWVRISEVCPQSSSSFSSLSGSNVLHHLIMLLCLHTAASILYAQQKLDENFLIVVIVELVILASYVIRFEAVWFQSCGQTILILTILPFLTLSLKD